MFAVNGFIYFCLMNFELAPIWTIQQVLIHAFPNSIDILTMFRLCIRNVTEIPIVSQLKQRNIIPNPIFYP